MANAIFLNRSIVVRSALTMIGQALCCHSEPIVLLRESSPYCPTIDTSTNLLKVSTALEELSGTNNALCFAGILLLLHAGATEESLQLCVSVFRTSVSEASFSQMAHGIGFSAHSTQTTFVSILRCFATVAPVAQDASQR